MGVGGVTVVWVWAFGGGLGKMVLGVWGEVGDVVWHSGLGWGMGRGWVVGKMVLGVESD